MKKNKFATACLLTCIVSLIVSLCSVFFSKTEAVAATYYETTTRVYIAKGISYETCRMVTDRGMLDVHVLKIPLDDPNITVGPVESTVAYGLKETTSKLLSDNNAIAGINGDFFGMNGSYSIPLGTEIIDGAVTSISDGFNTEEKNKASLIIDTEGNPFIDYITTRVEFINNGAVNVPVPHINKTVDLSYPVCLTRDVMTDTKKLDERVANSVKIVVENNIITYISQKGETVNIPENGFIIAMNSAHADQYAASCSIGQTAMMNIKTSVSLEKIQSAITGAGKLLENGQIANDSGFVVSGRHPRTALGISQDNNQLILMVVDGRNHSVGANHVEMADLMLRFGAYQAMHLDGGGSSTMVVRKYGQTSLSVINSPSDGSQRKVINALGVFLTAPVGELAGIAIETTTDKGVIGQPIGVTVYGIDNYFNRIELDKSLISIYTVDGSAVRSETMDSVTPTRTGIINILASYPGTVPVETTIESDRLAVLKPSVSQIKLGVGGTRALSFTGTGRNGNAVSVSVQKLNYEVVPAELGTVENGVFTASKIGSGYIRCYTGNDIDLVEAYIPVYATLVPELLEPLDGGISVIYTSSRYTLSGKAEYSDEQYITGLSSVRLDYNFSKSTETQAAYANFLPSIQIAKKPVALRIAVYGDSSNRWVRGKVKNAQGVVYNIDLVKKLDFTGWKDVDVILPEGISYPVTLEILYVVSLSEEEPVTSTIYFDDIRILKDTSIGLPSVVTPPATEYTDDLNVIFYDAPVSGADITVMGALGYTSQKAPENYETNRKKAIASFAKNSSNGLYFGSADLNADAGIQVLSNTGTYRPYLISDLYGIQIYSANGGIIASDKTQWAQLKNGILACPTDYMVIQTDMSPLRFNTNAEYQLLHDLFVQAVKLGKKVFVVSCDSGEQNTVTVRDGVRYINLGRLYINNELNTDFSVLRFRVNGNDIKYSIENVFK